MAMTVPLQTCRLCGVDKPLDREHFSPRQDFRLRFDTRCRQCCRAADRARRQRPGKLQEGADAQRARSSTMRATLDGLKDSPCVDCGIKYPPPVMEFDHVRGVKLFRIGVQTMRHPLLAAERAKCELRCANCHRLRHHAERDAL